MVSIFDLGILVMLIKLLISQFIFDIALLFNEELYLILDLLLSG